MLMVIVALIGKGAYDWAQRRYGRFYRLVGFWVFILGVCLADYVGHACGWADIYIRKDSNTPIPTELYNRVNRDWAPDDWSGGGDVGGFYDTDLRQYDLIPRLLMYGVKNENQGDIPAGAVYGLPKTGDLGYVNVGRYGFFTPSPRSL